ncbi:histamine N-methyltransferase-like [Antennarius striatus]|uniref:histamine N-methyltransferase-like n=1 Tax=Antennarius striatus TaxID=241820 RepID=UPI0035AF06C4
MGSPLPSLLTDGERYQKALQVYYDHSTDFQAMQDFINNLFHDIMSGTINGKSHINVLGIGSGPGDLDIELLSALHLKNPDMTVDNEVVEPTPELISKYKELVSQTPGLDYIKWNWNIMTVQEFEKDWKEKGRTKKFDFIHMFEMLYYVEDNEATVNFFRSLLNKDGKLIISVLDGNTGWGKLDKTYGHRFHNPKLTFVVSDKVKQYLDSGGVSYQSYLLPCEVDITKCFIEGNEEGELILEVITEGLNFKKSAPPELKAGIMELLRCPDCSVESNGKITLSANFEVIVVDQLS